MYSCCVLLAVATDFIAFCGFFVFVCGCLLAAEQGRVSIFVVILPTVLLFDTPFLAFAR